MTTSELQRNRCPFGLSLEHRRLKSCYVIMIIVSLITIGWIYGLEVIQRNFNLYRMQLADNKTVLVSETNLTINSIENEWLRALVNRNYSRSLINETFIKYKSIFHMSNINCANIFAGAKNDIEKGIQQAKKMKNFVQLLSDHFYINQTAVDCQGFLRLRGYLTYFLSEEERDFSIAYSLVVYKDAEMVDRLLRAIYRPQNIYCIHIDAKSDKTFVQALTGIAQCLPNVFVASRRLNVVWGEFSVLEPELICMEELWSKSRTWKYFINLTGQEFPLKTNAELIQILKAYDGANDIEGTIKRY